VEVVMVEQDLRVVVVEVVVEVGAHPHLWL
jgi:hypothetical protein